MKAVFIDDGIFTKDKILACKEKLAVLEGLEFDFARDTAIERYPGTLSEYILRFETNGPEGLAEPDAEVLEKIADADILAAHMSLITEEVIAVGKKLKLIYMLRSGVENVNITAAKTRGIPVCNTPSRLADPVADMAIALMLSECRGLVRGNLRQTGGQWQTNDIFDDRCFSSLRNLTVGLYGFGGIARALAKRLVHGFGSRVLAFDPYCDESIILGEGVDPVDMNTLLEESDILSVMARLTDENKNTFDAAAFAKMKPTAILINNARAGLVNEQALIDALRGNVIRGAGLDVFWEEPLPRNHPLLSMPNVTLTPHRSGVTNDIVPNTVNIMIPEFRRFLTGGKLQFEIKDQKGQG